MAEFISAAQVTAIIRSTFPEGNSLSGDPQGRIGTILAGIINAAVTKAVLETDGKIAALQSSGTLEERVLALESMVNQIQGYIGNLSNILELRTTPQQPPPIAPPSIPPPSVDNIGAGDVEDNINLEQQ